MSTRAGRLEGKVALVTRGGYGFGAGIVAKFVEEGAKVLVVDHSVTRGKEVTDEQPKGTAVFCRADPTKAEDWKRAVDKAVQVFGHLDIIVNHAGAVHRMMPSVEVPEADIDRVFEANIKTIYHCVQAVVPYFLSRAQHEADTLVPNGTKHDLHCHGCCILNISSISAPRPRPGLVFYAGTKSAGTAITKGLAAEYAPLGIRVNCVEPVAGDSALVPPRWADASVIGGRARAPSMAVPSPLALSSPGLTSPAVAGASALGPLTEIPEKDAPADRRQSNESVVSATSAVSLAAASTFSQSVVRTGIPLGRWATARDVANAACFLCSDEADFITGVALRVDGGRSLN